MLNYIHVNFQERLLKNKKVFEFLELSKEKLELAVEIYR